MKTLKNVVLGGVILAILFVMGQKFLSDHPQAGALPLFGQYHVGGGGPAAAKAPTVKVLKGYGDVSLVDGDPCAGAPDYASIIITGSPSGGKVTVKPTIDPVLTDPQINGSTFSWQNSGATLWGVALTTTPPGHNPDHTSHFIVQAGATSIELPQGLPDVIDGSTLTAGKICGATG